MAAIVKEKRIEFRVPDEAKKTIEEAARLSNISVSSYILSVVLKQARLDLEQSEIVTLSNLERDRLMEAFANPPAPNGALKGLFR